MNETEDEGYAEKSDSDPPTPPSEDGSVLGKRTVFQIRRGKRDNFGIISHISP